MWENNQDGRWSEGLGSESLGSEGLGSEGLGSEGLGSEGLDARYRRNSIVAKMFISNLETRIF